MRAERILAGLAAFAVGWAVAPGHPATRTGPLGWTGRELAGAAQDALRAVGTLGAVDSGAPAAAAVLAVSILVAGTVGIARLAGPERGDREGPGAGAAIPGAALAGHVAGLIAVANREGGAVFFAVTGGVAAAILLRAAHRAPSPGAAPERRGPARIAGILLLGAVLLLAGGAVDGILHAFARTRPFPEAWFVVAAESGAGWMRVPVAATLAAVAAGACGMERVLDARGGTGLPRVLLAAPAFALLLGPSNPARALALAVASDGLARAGAPATARAALPVLFAIGMAVLVHVA